MDRKMRRKLGMIIAIIGLAGTLILFAVKESNKPVKVTSSFGSGYMGGWSESTKDMLNTFIGIGALDTVIGLGLVVTSRNKKEE